MVAINRNSKTKILATLYIDENKFEVFLSKRFNEKISGECIRYFNEKGNLGIKLLGGKYNDSVFGNMNIIGLKKKYKNHHCLNFSIIIKLSGFMNHSEL